MATFQRITTVEARQYDGPRLTVVNDKLGEQVAVTGDWLLGTERGKISVVSRETFAAEYVPMDSGAADEKAALEAVVASLQKQIDDLKAANLQHEGDNLNLSNMLVDANAKIAELEAPKPAVESVATGEVSH